jgi:hypothetical protein
LTFLVPAVKGFDSRTCYWCDGAEGWPEGLNRPPVIVHFAECPLVTS